MMFTLKHEHLLQLCALNEYPVRTDEMVFVGLRGCLPVNEGDHDFAPQQPLEGAEIDHERPRCTLLQWLPQGGVFAAFPGSTVPSRAEMQRALARGGCGANQLLTGYFDDYRKGRHKGNGPTGHRAFQQHASRPFRRSADDLDYDLDDRVEFDNPGDNLHAAWCGGLASRYSSAGCQVVVGYPQCRQRGDQPSTGPWKAFIATAYAREQERFRYVLAHGFEAKRLVLAGPAGLERVRFGSSAVSGRAARVQAALQERGFYEGTCDGNFGGRSLRALLAFQTAVFGPGGDDGVCGPQTNAALGISWP